MAGQVNINPTFALTPSAESELRQQKTTSRTLTF